MVMNPQLLSEDDNTATVDAGDGKAVVVAKTPGNSGFIDSLRSAATSFGKAASDLNAIEAAPGAPTSLSGAFNQTAKNFSAQQAVPVQQEWDGSAGKLGLGSELLGAQPTAVVSGAAPTAGLESLPQAVPSPKPASVPGVSVEGGSVSAPSAASISSGGSPFSTGLALEKSAIEAQRKVGNLIAAEKLGAAEEIAAAAKARQSEMLRSQAEKEKELAEGEKKRVEAADAVKNFKFQDYWADRSTGAKIGAAIAMAFGAYASAITKGPNSAMQIIDGAIKRDGELQQKKFEQIKGSAIEADNAYGRLYKKLGDKDLAAQQFYITGLEAVKTKAEAQLAKLGGAQVDAEAKKTFADLQMKIDASKAEYGLKLEELGAKKRTAQAAMQENYIPALKIYATTKEGAGKINELAGATRSAQSGIASLMALAKEGGKSLNPETRAKAELIAATVQAALRVPILGPGTVNDAERALMKKIVSNPATIFSLDSVSLVRLSQLSERLETNLVQNAKAYQVPESGGGAGKILSSGMIKIRGSDGNEWNLPADKAQAALARGAEIVR